MFKLLLATILLLLLSGCGMSNLTHNNQQLTWQADKEYLQADDTLRKESFITLSPDKKVFRLDEDNRLVYLDTRTNILYKFEPSITSNITKNTKLIFNTKNVVITHQF